MADKTVASQCSAHPTSLKDETDDEKDKLSFAWQCKEGESTAFGDASSLRKMSCRSKRTMMRKKNSSKHACSFTGTSAESFSQSREKDIFGGTTNPLGSLKNTRLNGKAGQSKSYNHDGPSNKENTPLFVNHCDVKHFEFLSITNRQENEKTLQSGKICTARSIKFEEEICLTDDDKDEEEPYSIVTSIKTRNGLHSSSTKMSTDKNAKENTKRCLYGDKEKVSVQDASDGGKPHSIVAGIKTRNGLDSSSTKISSTVENTKENTKRCLYADRSERAHCDDRDMPSSSSKDTSTIINKKQIKNEPQEIKDDKYILLCHQPISNKHEITRSISEELTLITSPQLQRLSTTNMHILLPKSSTKELFAITVNEVTVKLTLKNHKCQVPYSTEEASNGRQCQCEEVLSALEKVLQEKNIQFSTLKAFDGKAFLKHLTNLTPIDYHYVNKTESLELKLDETMFQFLSSCVVPSDTDVEGYVNSMDVQTASWSLTRFAELRQTYNNMRRELSQLEDELRSVKIQKDEVDKRRNSKDLQDQRAEAMEISNASDANTLNRESNDCSPGPKCDDQNEISRSNLLDIIAISLERKEWEIARKEVSNVLSRRDRPELDQLQNGVDIFNYLQRKENLDDKAQLDYVRNILFVLGRVDLAHVIDCFKEGDYSSLLSVSNLLESRAIGSVRKKETHRGTDGGNSANCNTESDDSPFHVRPPIADNHLHGDSRSPLEHVEVFPDSVNDDRNSEHCEDLEVSCEHYERFSTVKFGCCAEFWACHRCHNAESKCGKEKLSSCDVQLIKCNRCDKIQEFPKERPHCIQCDLKISEYFCSICKHLTGTHNNPYHCKDCGICRVNGDRSFHCEICGYCMDVCLKGKHKCRPNSAHDKCFICLEDGFTGCQILPCSHKVHKACAQTMLRKGITSCPICRESFAHVLNRRPARK